MLLELTTKYRPKQIKDFIYYQDVNGEIPKSIVESFLQYYAALYILYVREAPYLYQEELFLDVFFNLRLLPNIEELKLEPYICEEYSENYLKDLPKVIILCP
jgi:hypothetical protein